MIWTELAQQTRPGSGASALGYVVLGIAGLVATAITAIMQTRLANTRHAGQLRHDRRIADRAAIQDVLDAAATALRGLVWSTDDLLDQFKRGNIDEINEAARVARERMREAVEVGSRLALRIGRNNALATSYDAALGEFVHLLQALHAGTPSGLQRFVTRRERLSSQYEDLVSGHADRLAAARNEFLDQGHALVGVMLTPD